LTEIERELRATPEAGRVARRALDGWLTDLVGEETADNVRLAATECIDNAVRHGRLSEDDVIVLFGVATEDIVRIEIEQPTPVGDLHVIDPLDRGAAEGGFGLGIVQDVTSSWGVVDEGRGVVWFEVDRDIP
jgi:anti-sigma regulatory factor (Ser/Thr protein kinase)